MSTQSLHNLSNVKRLPSLTPGHRRWKEAAVRSADSLARALGGHGPLSQTYVYNSLSRQTCAMSDPGLKN